MGSRFTIEHMYGPQILTGTFATEKGAQILWMHGVSDLGLRV